MTSAAEQPDDIETPDLELPGMWERADFTGGRDEAEEMAHVPVEVKPGNPVPQDVLDARAAEEQRIRELTHCTHGGDCKVPGHPDAVHGVMCTGTPGCPVPDHPRAVHLSSGISEVPRGADAWADREARHVGEVYQQLREQIRLAVHERDAILGALIGAMPDGLPGFVLEQRSAGPGPVGFTYRRCGQLVEVIVRAGEERALPPTRQVTPGEMMQDRCEDIEPEYREERETPRPDKRLRLPRGF